jgi:hypothetical protein
MVRILPQAEADAAWAALAHAWDIRAQIWWFPLVETRRTGVAAFEAASFHATLGPSWLRGVLAARGVEAVVHFPEFAESPVHETSLGDASFRYDGEEGYWCDAREAGRDWLVYASHEDSVTVGGAWLIDQIQRAWPEWAAHLWNGSPDSYRAAAT